MKHSIFCGTSLWALAAALALTAGTAAAQVPAGADRDVSDPSAEQLGAPPAGNQEDPTEVEAVVVTGSFIRGTPEDAALPVDVVTSEELAERGSPTTVEFIKSLPISGPVLGDSNQFSAAAAGQIGVGSINLRGLGSLRTLVLMNGRRTVASPGAGSGGTDTNLLPIAAIGRVEILKDGAAAVYGSDAIAGVANFITRTNLQGFEVSGDYRYVPGADGGDYGGSINFGHVFDNGNVLFSAGYQHRAELSSTERDFSRQEFLKNPSGFSVLGQPPSFLPRNGLTPTAGVQRDANCNAVGGFAGFSGATPACFFTFVPFDNLVEKENRAQLYAEVNFDLGDKVRFHAESLYAKTEIPQYRLSPSFPPTSGPNGPGSVGVFTTPIGNPGALTALQQAGLSPAQIAATNNISLTLFRALGAGGNNSTGGLGGQLGHRDYDVFRISASLSGELDNGIGWDVAVTYSDSTNNQFTTDILIDRLQRALNGFGGPNCTGTTPGANGCQFFNPFSNAYPGNPALGLTNPGFVPANANSPELVASLFTASESDTRQSLLVIDAVANGELNFFELPGGKIGYAVGVQSRKIENSTRLLNDLTDARITPCPRPGDTTCTFRTGPLIFLGQSVPSALQQDVRAVFAEASVPFTDRFNAQLAVRYEDYGGLTGATTNPKLAAKWELTDWLALRGSVGTTFRGPIPANQSPGGVTGLTGITAAGNNFKSVDFFGNPAIGPETAQTYNIGAIVEVGGLRAIVDYYNFKIEDQIVTLPAQIVATSVAGPGSGTQQVNCSAALRSLITFSNNNACVQGTTIGNDIQRVRSDTVNGPEITTSGIDATVDYNFPQELLGADLTVGAAISYVLEYDQAAFTAGGVTVSPAYSAVGFTNYDRLPGTIPQYRANAYVDINRGIHNLRAFFNYIDGVTDDRAPIFVQNGPSTTPCNASRPNPPCVPITFGQEVEAFYTVDMTYRAKLPRDTTFSATVFNLLDRDPAPARLPYNYDPFVGNPLGRTYKVAVTKKF